VARFEKKPRLLEAGDPSVGIGIVATALWFIQRDGEFAKLASPEHDHGAIEMEIKEAMELGRARQGFCRSVHDYTAAKINACGLIICICGFLANLMPRCMWSICCNSESDLTPTEIKMHHLKKGGKVRLVVSRKIPHPP
jgi:hypothetical protein